MPASDSSVHQPTYFARFEGDGLHGNLETMLFEALVHLLIEKGVLTANDALSVVQTVAEVRTAQLAEPESASDLAMLKRLYGSFEALSSRISTMRGNASNVRQLRPPLHRDAPEFPAAE